MPPAAGFDFGSVCGPLETCGTWWLRNTWYAASKSFTTMATC